VGTTKYTPLLASIEFNYISIQLVAALSYDVPNNGSLGGGGIIIGLSTSNISSHYYLHSYITSAVTIFFILLNPLSSLNIND